MKKPLVITLTLFTLALPVTCQYAQAEPSEVRRAEAVERTQRRPGFFERLFKGRKGEKQREPEAASTPPTKRAIPTKASEIEETPKPLKRRRTEPTPTPTPSEEESESTKVSTEPSPSQEPSTTPEMAHPGGESKEVASKPIVQKSTPTPEPEPELKPESTPKIEVKPDSAQLTQPIPFVSAPEPEKSLATPVPDLLDPEYVKRMNDRYNEVRSTALSDEKVSALRDEADGAFEPSKRAKALTVYYEALFEKMREIDPSLKSRIDGREKATMRRIESLTPVGE